VPDFQGRDRGSDPWSGGRKHPTNEEPPPVVIRDKRKFDSDGNLRAGAAEPPGRPAHSADASELREGEESVSARTLDAEMQLAERTADLQRLTAEYANYRKRVDRDRVVIGEVAMGRVLEAMLPVLDDIERAAAHGDLNGAFKTVADKLIGALSGLGLTPFGEPGDPFDPAVHEAVMHGESDVVEAPTATTIMRRGYRLKDRLLRPAMVGVTDPIAAEPVVAESAVSGETNESNEPSEPTS